jgi:hypothetical protein
MEETNALRIFERKDVRKIQEGKHCRITTNKEI